MRISSGTWEALDSSARLEEVSLSAGSFTGYIGKAYCRSLCTAALVGTIMGVFLLFSIGDLPSGAAFAALGIISALLLPTVLSYRCQIDNMRMVSKYFILCFPVSKAISWKDVRYKQVKTTPSGHLLSIRFYNERKKKLILFDSSIVGFSRIVRMAKRKGIPKK